MAHAKQNTKHGKQFNTGLIQSIMDNCAIRFHTTFSGTVRHDWVNVVPILFEEVYDIEGEIENKKANTKQGGASGDVQDNKDKKEKKDIGEKLVDAAKDFVVGAAEALGFETSAREAKQQSIKAMEEKIKAMGVDNPSFPGGKTWGPGYRRR